MEKFIAFIIENKELLILAAACLLDLILFLVGVLRKKKTTPLGEVIIGIPSMIKLVEDKFGPGNGESKKETVMYMALALYKQLTGVDITANSYLGKEISSFIERCLETPTKKGK